MRVASIVLVGDTESILSFMATTDVILEINENKNYHLIIKIKLTVEHKSKFV